MTTEDDNRSKFKLHFETLCESYGLKRKPTSIKNPQANAILERVHQTIMAIFRTSEIDMADTVNESDIADFLTNAAWAVCSTYHKVLKTSLQTKNYCISPLHSSVSEDYRRYRFM